MPNYDMSAAYGNEHDPAPANGDEEADPTASQPVGDRSPRPRDRFGRPRPRGAPDEMAHAQEPEDVVDTLEEAFERAVELFDAQRFFEAHEFFEHIWKSSWIDPADKDFWKGVTQAAVGCCHVQRGNDTGALALLERAAHYLDDTPAHYRGVDVARLIEATRQIAARTREHGATPDVDFPRFPRADQG